MKYGHSHWIFRCDCGTEKMVNASRVISGAIKSCGCLVKEVSGQTIKHALKFKTLDSGQAALNAYFAAYKIGAKKRNYEFNLTKDQFKEICLKNCEYCGKEPLNEIKQRQNNGAFVSNGVDRVNNTKGYTLDNVVPCCKHCNLAKLDMTVDEFKSWIKRMYIFNFGDN